MSSAYKDKFERRPGPGTASENSLCQSEQWSHGPKALQRLQVEAEAFEKHRMALSQDVQLFNEESHRVVQGQVQSRAKPSQAWADAAKEAMSAVEGFVAPRKKSQETSASITSMVDVTKANQLPEENQNKDQSIEGGTLSHEGAESENNNSNQSVLQEATTMPHKPASDLLVPQKRILWADVSSSPEQPEKPASVSLIPEKRISWADVSSSPEQPEVESLQSSCPTDVRSRVSLTPFRTPQPIQGRRKAARPKPFSAILHDTNMTHKLQHLAVPPKVQAHSAPPKVQAHSARPESVHVAVESHKLNLKLVLAILIVGFAVAGLALFVPAGCQTPSSLCDEVPLLISFGVGYASMLALRSMTRRATQITHGGRVERG